jgi:hypothetical protein
VVTPEKLKRLLEAACDADDWIEEVVNRPEIRQSMQAWEFVMLAEFNEALVACCQEFAGNGAARGEKR